VSFETFTGSVDHTGPEKFPCKATCVYAFFSSENPRKQPDTKEFKLIIQRISLVCCLKVSQWSTNYNFVCR